MNDTMKMRNVLSVEQARKSVTAGAVCPICGHNTNNPNPISAMKICNRTSADSVNSDTVNEVGFPERLPCTDVTGEETESIGLDSGEAEPTDLVADAERRAEWDKIYKLAWKFKSRLLKEYHGRIGFPISDDDMLRILKE